VIHITECRGETHDVMSQAAPHDARFPDAYVFRTWKVLKLENNDPRSSHVTTFKLHAQVTFEIKVTHPREINSASDDAQILDT